VAVHDAYTMAEDPLLTIAAPRVWGTISRGRQSVEHVFRGNPAPAR